MMFKDDDFQQMSESESSDMTVFVPSPVSLQNITATSSILTQVIKFYISGQYTYIVFILQLQVCRRKIKMTHETDAYCTFW
jgi:hypothetical protein